MAGATVTASGPDLNDLQGLIRSGYSTLPHARYCLYTIGSPDEGRAFLRAVLPQVTTAAQRDVALVTQVAFSAAGLAALAVPDEVIGAFSLEFVGGLTAPARSAFLGDVGDQAPTEWVWGGPGQSRVDVLLMTFAPSTEELARFCTELDLLASGHGLAVAAVLDTAAGATAEPFGFRDGLSQPSLKEFASSRAGSASLGASSVAAASSGAFTGRPVALGEFVLGYPNEYGQLTERPVLPKAMDPAALLPADPAGSGGADLGCDGSYLVLRTMRQDVAGFWAYVRQASALVDGLTATALAAKFVGRWPSGAPLTLAPVQDDPALGSANDFGFHDADELGYACPIGAHIRRANPRDSLDPHPGSTKSVAVTDRHRLLRRGRAYGPLEGDHRGNVGGWSTSGEQGLHFMALNANLARQFEFIQHSWLNSTKFAGLNEDVDPITAHRGPQSSTFTAPAEPYRQRLENLPSFVTVTGGAYFFLPGVRALAYLAQGRG
jgi:Dyp-type peroxidase family